MEYLKATIILKNRIENEAGNFNNYNFIKELIREAKTLKLTNDGYIFEAQFWRHNYYYTLDKWLQTYYNYVDYIITKDIEELETIEEKENISAICCDCYALIHENETSFTNIEGDEICEECRDDHYTECEHCDELLHNDYIHWAYNDEGCDVALCESCYDNETFYCDDCERTIYSDDYYNDRNCHTICSECYNDHWHECSNCGENVPDDECELTDDYEYICNQCREELENEEEEEASQMLSYHNSGRDTELRSYDKILHVTENDNFNKTMGYELETEQGNSDTSRAHYCKTLDAKMNEEKRHIHFEEDSSLQRGVEIISEPMTLEYWNAEKEGKWSEMLETCNSMGYQSHNGGRCGLHVHFNKNWFGKTEQERNEKLETLFLFFENYKDEIISFSRRDYFGFCEFLSRKGNNVDILQNLHDTKLQDKITKSTQFINARKTYTGHHDAINVDTSTGKTYEIRILRGTLKKETFIASIEFIVNLLECIANEPRENISFTKVVNYKPTKYLKAYIKEREIKANYKKIKDYTNECENIIQKIKKDVTNTKTQITTELSQKLNDLVNTLNQYNTEAREETLLNNYNRACDLVTLSTDVQTNIKAITIALTKMNRDNDYYTAKVALRTDYNGVHDVMNEINKLNDIENKNELLRIFN